jgi:hypothetical protein
MSNLKKTFEDVKDFRSYNQDNLIFHLMELETHINFLYSTKYWKCSSVYIVDMKTPNGSITQDKNNTYSLIRNGLQLLIDDIGYATELMLCFPHGRGLGNPGCCG